MFDKGSRRSYLRASGAALTVGLAGCTSLGIGGGGDTIKIGNITPRSGAYAALGNYSTWAQEVMIEDINERDGINGRELEMVTRDSELDPQASTNKANDLIRSEGVDLLSGTIASSVSLAVGQVADREGIPLGVSNSATRQLTAENCSPYIYQFRSNPEMQHLGLVPMLREQGHQTASFAYSDYAWGQSSLQFFRQIWQDNGGELLSEVGAPLGTSDFSPYFPNIDTSADVLIVMFGGTDAQSFISQAADFGLQDQMQFVGTGAPAEFLLESKHPAANGMIGLDFYCPTMTGPLDNPGNQQFHDRYKEKSDGTPPNRSTTSSAEFLQAIKHVGDDFYEGTDTNDQLAEEMKNFDITNDWEGNQDLQFQFPQGPKYIRESDGMVMIQQYFYEIQNSNENITSISGISQSENVPDRCN